jgi:hypothetical protein
MKALGFGLESLDLGLRFGLESLDLGLRFVVDIAGLGVDAVQLRIRIMDLDNIRSREINGERGSRHQGLQEWSEHCSSKLGPICNR